MNRTDLTALLPLLVTFTLSCSDAPSPAEPAAPDRVSTEPANAESATIGASGGSVSAVAGDGTIYTLSVPAGALRPPVSDSIRVIFGRMGSVIAVAAS